MSGIAKKMLMGAAGAGALDIADAFSTDLYTGNGSTQTITNGVNLAGEGGLVWIKGRSGATDHQLFDTERGATKQLRANSTDAEATDADALTAFNLGGFSIGADAKVNTNTATYAAWTFRQAPKLFDVVTYTGDGVAGRTIAHNLGIEPGMIVVKRRNTTGGWPVYHRSNTAAPETDYLLLNDTAATADLSTYWNDTAPTNSLFTVGSNSDVNASGGTYVAYLFAHDTAADGFIQCGSYTGNGSATGPVINLGWEPQWLLIKRSDSAGNWIIYDNARDTTNPRTAILLVASSSAEINSTEYSYDFTSTGFQVKTSGILFNASGGSYIYVAIRAEGA